MLQGRTVLVTGGAQGIGFGVTQASLALGAKVVTSLLSVAAAITLGQAINMDGGNTSY